MSEAKTVRVRIAVAVNSKGEYACAWGSGQDDSEAQFYLEMNCGKSDVVAIHWVEADVPIPTRAMVCDYLMEQAKALMEQAIGQPEMAPFSQIDVGGWFWMGSELFLKVAPANGGINSVKLKDGSLHAIYDGARVTHIASVFVHPDTQPVADRVPEANKNA